MSTHDGDLITVNISKPVFSKLLTDRFDIYVDDLVVDKKLPVTLILLCLAHSIPAKPVEVLIAKKKFCKRVNKCSIQDALLTRSIMVNPLLIVTYRRRVI